jgi:hypothetical protein
MPVSTTERHDWELHWGKAIGTAGETYKKLIYGGVGEKNNFLPLCGYDRLLVLILFVNHNITMENKVKIRQNLIKTAFSIKSFGYFFSSCSESDRGSPVIEVSSF